MVFKVEHRIGISVPVDLVYEKVADIESWPQWSPIHKLAQGRLGFGASVRLEETYEGLGQWHCQGHVSDWTPLSHIHIEVPKKFYEGRLIRYFEFESLSDTGSLYSVGAAFYGFLSEREGRKYAKFLKQGFQAMGEALKSQLETPISGT